MGQVLMAGIVPKLAVPSVGLPLSDLMEGQIVMINENGTPVPFYLAKHDYESGLNGNGRVLMVRKDAYDMRVWHSSDINNYPVSTIDAWLNGDYKSTLDAGIQKAMGTTGFYYTISDSSYTESILQRSVFLLSGTEIGLSGNHFGSLGEVLPIASILRVAKNNGTAVNQWTRSIHQQTGGFKHVIVSTASGGTDARIATTYNAVYSRPCFTLPFDMLVEEEPNADGSVNLKV